MKHNIHIDEETIFDEEPDETLKEIWMRWATDQLCDEGGQHMYQLIHTALLLKLKLWFDVVLEGRPSRGLLCAALAVGSQSEDCA